MEEMVSMKHKKKQRRENRQIMYYEGLVKGVKIKQKSITIHGDGSAPWNFDFDFNHTGQKMASFSHFSTGNWKMSFLPSILLFLKQDHCYIKLLETIFYTLCKYLHSRQNQYSFHIFLCKWYTLLFRTIVCVQ